MQCAVFIAPDAAAAAAIVAAGVAWGVPLTFTLTAVVDGSTVLRMDVTDDDYDTLCDAWPDSSTGWVLLLAGDIPTEVSDPYLDPVFP